MASIQHRKFNFVEQFCICSSFDHVVNHVNPCHIRRQNLIPCICSSFGNILKREHPHHILIQILAPSKFSSCREQPRVLKD
uniref:Uncharacterized protein n=1 Tax=Physcomitrium patens TaxID=3218 RepID=A0A7I4EQX0_PHYPA